MDRVFRQADKSIEDILHVAVVIAEPIVNQRHTGIAYRVAANDPYQFLHLAGHCRLYRDSTIDNAYCWVTPSINPRRLIQLAGICDAIANENPQSSIRYGLSSPIGVFDKTTKKFLLGPTEGGLTCASFVLAVFEVAQLQLVEYSGWPAPDTEDYLWQEVVCNHLQELRRKQPHLVSAEHLDCVRNDLGTSTRFRPEQVAGAAAIRDRSPVKYKYARAIGRDVVRYLRGEQPANEFRLSLWDRVKQMMGLL